MIKLIASDLDGTLLNENHMTDSYILDTVKMVKESGRIFAVATGRSLHFHELNRLRLNSVYKISMNGAVVKDMENNVLYRKPLPKEFLYEFIDLIKDEDVDYCGEEYTYSSMSLEKKIEKFKIKGFKDAAGNPSRIRDFFMDYRFGIDKEELMKLNIYKINTNASGKEIIDKINSLLDKYKNYVVNAPSVEVSFEITSKDANKGDALAFLTDYLSIKEDETVVYGDSGNDISMLKRFDNSYSLENGTKEAKETAKHLLGSNKDYAVSKHIRSIIDY